MNNIRSILVEMIGVLVISASAVHAEPKISDFDVYFSSWQVLYNQISVSVHELTTAIPELSRGLSETQKARLDDESTDRKAKAIYNAAIKENGEKYEAAAKQINQRHGSSFEANLADLGDLNKDFAASNDKIFHSYLMSQSDKADVENNKLEEKYPGLALMVNNQFFSEDLLWSDDRYISDPKQLSDSFQKRINQIDGMAPNKCLDISKTPPAFQHGPNCDFYLHACKQWGYKSKDGGGIMAEVLGDDLSIEKVSLDTIRDAVQLSGIRPLGHWIGVDFAFNACAAISFSGEPLQAGFAKLPMETPHWAGRPFEVETLEHLLNLGDTGWKDTKQFQKECIDTLPPDELSKRLDAILGQYPDLFIIADWKKNLDQRRNLCEKSAVTICGHTYSLSGTQVLSYATTACKTVDVTATDLSRLMQTSDTDLHRLQFSTLRDAVTTCQQAEGVGYWWDYRPVTLGQECRSKKTTIPSTHQKVKTN